MKSLTVGKSQNLLFIAFTATFVLIPQLVFADGQGYVPAKDTRELVFSYGQGPQGGSGGMQTNQAFVVDYQFKKWQLSENIELFLGAGFTHIWCNCVSNDKVNAISFGPGLKFHFLRSERMDPFFYVSIAPTYVDHTSLGTQDQGANLLFSDPFGFGVYFGKDKSWIATLGWHHLSNGNLFPPNPGFDVPLNLGIGKRF